MEAATTSTEQEVIATTGGRHANSCAPSQRFILQAIFLLLGVGILVPWNAFISAKSYFQSRLCAETGDHSATASIESWFAMVYNLSSVISLGLLISIQGLRDQRAAAAADAELEIREPLAPCETETATGGSSSPVMVIDASATNDSNNASSESKAHAVWLVMAPLGLYLIVFMLTDFLVLWSSVSVSAFAVLTLVGLAVCGMCASIASAGIVATAGLFPPNISMNPFLAGQSAGGVAVSFANFIAACLEDPALYWNAHCSTNIIDDYSYEIAQERILLVLPDEDWLEADSSDSTCVAYEQVDWAVFFYFFMGSVVLACCLLGYMYIDRFQQQRHRDEYETINDNEQGDVAVSGTVDSPRIGLELNDSNLRLDDSEAADRFAQELVVDCVETDDSGTDESLLQVGEPSNDTVAAWTHVKGPATCIFLTFFVTLSLFPGWTSELQSVRQCQTHFRLANDLFTPFGFLLFNVGDLLGRLLSVKITQGRILVRHLSTKLVSASALRFLFFPLLFMCVGGARDGFQIHSDVYSLVVQFSFAVTNGLLVSTAFVHAPSLLPGTTHMQERSSELLTFAVAFGLLSGSLFSFPVSRFAT